MPHPVSTRWCPTPEQLMFLEDMYRTGLRTPNASQIQQITAHLSFFGKIEGKNVFYWFQNHKARDKQKLRRRLNQQLQQQQQQQYNHHLTNFPSLLLHNTPQFHQETSEVMNLVCKLENGGREGKEKMVLVDGHEWMMMGMGSIPCCNRPLETLELFPMRSTGLKEEKRNSSSSSFSPSTSSN